MYLSPLLVFKVHVLDPVKNYEHLALPFGRITLRMVLIIPALVVYNFFVIVVGFLLFLVFFLVT